MESENNMTYNSSADTRNWYGVVWRFLNTVSNERQQQITYLREVN